MPVTRVEVDENECAHCGYKWISRVNGQDKPKPSRCAKCKKENWDKGHIDRSEASWRDHVKHRLGGYFNYPGGMFHGGWSIDKNVKRYLECRPSVKEMEVLMHPMSYLYHYTPSRRKPKVGCVTASDKKHVDMEATKKAHEYEKQLSRQLLKDLMIQRGIPYDENEAKMQLLYSRHGKYATFAIRHIPEMCDALKKDIPELSNEDIKAKILKDCSEQFEYLVKSPEELIKSSFPDWLITA